MPLTSGSCLGPYEIIAPLGAGGMGEVYRARDAKLGREVALKVLPEAFAGDTQSMARFQREAKVLASLNHPNIATIYGLEDSGGIHALVMERRLRTASALARSKSMRVCASPNRSANPWNTRTSAGLCIAI
jgi:serine/threonine protein kinase